MLKRLRYFVAVATEQHFGRAAEKLHMSQSPLSQQIRRLEEEIGVTLFNRNTRHVELTEAGHFVFKNVQSVLGDLDRIVGEARSLHCGEHGEIRFGIIATATYTIFPRLLDLLRKKFPPATFHLAQLNAAVLKQRVLDHQIDVGVVRGEVDSRFMSKLIAREPLFAALPEGHALSAQPAIAMSALKNENFVMWDFKGAANVAAEISRLCANHGIRPKVVHESPQFLALLSLVAGGSGIAIVPESVVHFGQPGVVFKRIIDNDAYSEVSLIWSPDSPSALVRRFVEQVPAIQENQSMQTALA